MVAHIRARVLAGLAFTTLGIVSWCSPVWSQTVQQIARTAFPSVVLLSLNDASGQPVALGSGLFVGDGLIATNMHVIDGASSGFAKIVGQEKKYTITGTVAKDSAHDLVILSVTGASASPLTLGQSDEASVGDEIYVVGNPLGLEGTFSSGIISGIRRLGPDSILQITAPISPGSSGGPVLDNRGRVIGVAVATFKDGQNLNFAIPVSYLSALLAHRGPLAPLTTSGHARPEQSLTASLGGSSAGGVVGTEFAWEATNLLALYGDFSFSLRNQLKDAVAEVHYAIVFYDRSGKPIETYDSVTLAYNGVIPAGLARRETGSVDSSVRPLTARVQIRVLDFKFEEEAAKPAEGPKPEAPAAVTSVSIPREWMNVEDGNAVTVRSEDDYLYEQSSFSGDGRYIQEGSYICETKRQGDHWVGKCNLKLLLVWGYRVAPTWCPLELEETVASVSPHRIEGVSQVWDYPTSIDQCPRAGQARAHFALIPKD
jgi:trypsin-like peptidase